MGPIVTFSLMTASSATRSSSISGKVLLASFPAVGARRESVARSLSGEGDEVVGTGSKVRLTGNADKTSGIAGHEAVGMDMAFDATGHDVLR